MQARGPSAPNPSVLVSKKAALSKAAQTPKPKPKPPPWIAKPKARLPTPLDREISDLKLEKRVLEIRLAKVQSKLTCLEAANRIYERKNYFGASRNS